MLGFLALILGNNLQQQFVKILKYSKEIVPLWRFARTDAGECSTVIYSIL